MSASLPKEEINARYAHIIRPKRKIPPIPKYANWGWLHYPAAIRLQTFAVFFGTVAVTTPFWAYVYSDPGGYATFGLWHLCIADVCSSIHDNLIPGRDVPAWYFLVQGTYSIGVVGSCICLGILTHNVEENRLRMTPTVHRLAFCLLCITVFQQFLAIYTLLSYIDDTDFLYERIDWEMDMHGSFYSALVGMVLTLVTTIIVFLDDDCTKCMQKTITKQPRGALYMVNDMYYNKQSAAAYPQVYDGYQYVYPRPVTPGYPIQRQPRAHREGVAPKIHKS